MLRSRPLFSAKNLHKHLFRTSHFSVHTEYGPVFLYNCFATRTYSIIAGLSSIHIVYEQLGWTYFSNYLGSAFHGLGGHHPSSDHLTYFACSHNHPLFIIFLLSFFLIFIEVVILDGVLAHRLYLIIIVLWNILTTLGQIFSDILSLYLHMLCYLSHMFSVFYIVYGDRSM